MAFSGDLTYEQARLPEEQKTVPRYESLIRHLVDPYKGGMTAVHELMHIAVKGRHKGTSHPVGDDVDYADAAAALAGDENPNYTKVANKGSAGSAYWGERLHQACGYPSHLSHQFTDYKLYKFGLPVPTASPKNIAGKIGEEDKDANKSE